MENRIVWSADSGIGKGLQAWHKKLEDDRGTRAMLRRCTSLDDAVLSPAYQHFYRYMLGCGWPEDAADWQKDKLAAIAVLVAMLKNGDGQEDEANKNVDNNLPHCMSEQKSERIAVSELRFRALLKIDDTEDLLTGLRRILPMIGRKTSLLRLANDVYYWGNKTKKQWAYDYRWPSKNSS